MIEIDCPECGAGLMNVMLGGGPGEATIAARCPFCREVSYERHITGTFYPGGVGRPRPDDDTDDIPSTVVEDFEVVGKTIIFDVRKATPDAKPVRR